MAVIDDMEYRLIQIKEILNEKGNRTDQEYRD